jgi:ribosome-associated translation inhibitor RaiA/cold shock CspA family protein
MQVPLIVTFHNVDKSADIEELIRTRADKLDRACERIVACRVTVEKQQDRHKNGNPFRVRIDVTVPPEHELVVARETGAGDLHEQLRAAVRDAFDAMRRRLKKLVEKQRGDVKSHPAQEPAGVVIRLFREQGYGFIKSFDDREIYFHKNSFAGDEFGRIAIGTGVQWFEEQGDKGPQASTVRIVDKPGSTISKMGRGPN